MEGLALNSQFQTSWEEKAFTADISGPLGGSIWPPRSYFCSFCKREFRSAQALGGHMNIHRKDRAKLKQSLISSNTQSFDENDCNFSLGTQFSSQVSTFCCNSHYPNLSTHQEDHHQNGFICKEKAESGSDSIGVKLLNIFDSNADLSVGMNFFLGENRSNGLVMSCKRAKMADSEVSMFFVKDCSNDVCSVESEVIGLKHGSMEDLDLELRLGDPPNCKKGAILLA